MEEHLNRFEAFANAHLETEISCPSSLAWTCHPGAQPSSPLRLSDPSAAGWCTSHAETAGGATQLKKQHTGCLRELQLNDAMVDQYGLKS